MIAVRIVRFIRVLLLRDNRGQLARDAGQRTRLQK
jgi:hypothetical protein